MSPSNRKHQRLQGSPNWKPTWVYSMSPGADYEGRQQSTLSCIGNMAYVTGGFLVTSKQAEKDKISFFVTPGFREKWQHGEKKHTSRILHLLHLCQSPYRKQSHLSVSSLHYKSTRDYTNRFQKKKKKSSLFQNAVSLHRVRVTAWQYPCRRRCMFDKTTHCLFKNREWFVRS